MADEPRHHIGYLVAVAMAALGTVPFLFVGREYRVVVGLPLWLWSSLLFTVLLSVLTAWGILRYWKDADDD